MTHKARKVTNESCSLWRVKQMPWSLFPLYFSVLFLLLDTFPPRSSLPQGRLIKTNAIVGYQCYTRAQRAAGSYFSFSLVWWCDFVFLRNRFVSNGSVYLSSLSPFSLFPLCKGKDGVLWAALPHYLESAESCTKQGQAQFTRLPLFYIYYECVALIRMHIYNLHSRKMNECIFKADFAVSKWKTDLMWQKMKQDK